MIDKELERRVFGLADHLIQEHEDHLDFPDDSAHVHASSFIDRHLTFVVVLVLCGGFFGPLLGILFIIWVIGRLLVYTYSRRRRRTRICSVRSSAAWALVKPL